MSLHFHPVKIVRIKDETPDAYTLYFEKPADPVFNYLAGQYLTLKVKVNGDSQRRVFSLSSSPVIDDHLSVTIKRVPNGVVSNFIREHLGEGDVVEVLPPLGKFTVEPNPDQQRHYVLIGGGSGITPLMSIIKTVLRSEPESKLSLWYCNRDLDSVIFRKELAELEKQYSDRLSVLHTLTQPQEGWEGFTGRLDEQRIYDLLKELFMEDTLKKQYFLCGPEGLMDAAEKAMEKHAVNPGDIHREYYSAPTPTQDDLKKVYTSTEEETEQIRVNGDVYDLKEREVEVIMDGRPYTLQVKPRQSILDAAIEADLDPPFACQSGICTTCRAQLHRGVVSMDEMEGLSEAELAEGFVLTCQCHPLTANVRVEYP